MSTGLGAVLVLVWGGTAWTALWTPKHLLSAYCAGVQTPSATAQGCSFPKVSWHT